MKKLSLRVKLIGGIILSIFITVAAVNVAFAIISYNNAQDAAGRVYQNISYEIADYVEKNIREVHIKLDAFSMIPSIADPKRPVDERVAVSRAVQASLGDFALLKMTDLNGMELVKSDEADIDLSNRAYVQAALNGQKFVTAPFYSPILNRMVFAVAQPLRWEGELIGMTFMLLPGDFLNNAIEAVRAGYDGYAFVVDSNGALISHNDIIGRIEREEHQYLEMAKTDKAFEGLAGAVRTMLDRGEGTVRFTDENGENMLGGFSSTSQGWSVMVCSTIADVQTDTNHAILIAIIISVVCIALSAVFAFFFAGTITTPLLTLSAFLHKAGTTGDVSTTPDEGARLRRFELREDEVGQMTRDCGAFIGHVRESARVLETVAGGDLSVEVKMLSASDTIGKSLTTMIERLSSTFAEIDSSSNQVSSGSRQIADGAQSLAQGATQQAASVQQLSATIESIAMGTKESADIAAKASALTGTIKDNAEKGSRQMDEMMIAVKDINAASQSVGKIIKTIDDIAFQTNILALNAAVEAARAGQHGKGFAVVAEEVRNLASKSAEAAKETGHMIQDSMDKANLGFRIAEETSTSLAEIVSGINESSQLIAEIARASDGQSQSIEQINSGIDQVAQVVGQNSAMAQQSAAASEQMSEQSESLQQLIAQFKLKNNKGSFRGLPQSDRPVQRRAQVPDQPGPKLPGGDANFGKY